LGPDELALKVFFINQHNSNSNVLRAIKVKSNEAAET
jgi:hypothetical protein